MGLARLIAELIERLELADVTLIGNDTGGALCQLVAAQRPELVGRLVPTNCDAFEHFPPPAFRLLIKGLGGIPGALAVLAALGTIKPLRQRSMSLTPLTVEPIPDRLLKDWIAPLKNRQIRRDTRKFLRGISPEYIEAAAERLRSFDRPVLIVWGTRDRFFPLADAERLAALFPHASLHKVPEARAFVQIDAPERLAELTSTFINAQQAAA